MLLEPMEKEIDGKIYVLSKFSAVTGLEIMLKYNACNFPNITDYLLFEECCSKLMNYVGVPMAGKQPLMLSTRALIENHVPHWRTFLEIQEKMLEYNRDFLKKG